MRVTTIILAVAVAFSSASFAETTAPGNIKFGENGEIELALTGTAGDAASGRKLFMNRKKGNCLACHHAIVDNWPATLPPGGNIGPPFVAMSARFPNSEDLRAQIWDPTVKNPNSSMPPFGKHKLISEQDIDNIVAWLSTL